MPKLVSTHKFQVYSLPRTSKQVFCVERNFSVQLWSKLSFCTWTWTKLNNCLRPHNEFTMMVLVTYPNTLLQRTFISLTHFGVENFSSIIGISVTTDYTVGAALCQGEQRLVEKNGICSLNLWSALAQPQP